MESTLPHSISYNLKEQIVITPEIAVEKFNGCKKTQNIYISKSDIINIEKDIAYKIMVCIDEQERKLELVTMKNVSNKNYNDPVRISNPWNIEIPSEQNIKAKYFTINNSYKTIRCPDCKNSGQMVCSKCSGQGMKLCPTCHGVNSIVEESTSKKKGVVTRGLVGGALLGPVGMVVGAATAKTKTVTSSQRCTTCFGNGSVVCNKCNGSRFQPCTECDGNGTLIKYQRIAYKNICKSDYFFYNPFNSRMLSFVKSEVIYKIEGDKFSEDMLIDFPEEESSKFSSFLVNKLIFPPKGFIKFHIEISAIPIYNIIFNLNNDQKEFHLVGSELIIESEFIKETELTTNNKKSNKKVSSSSSNEPRWYEDIFLVFGLLFLFPPLGIILLWKVKRLDITNKLIYTIIFSVWTYLLLKLFVLDPINNNNKTIDYSEQDFRMYSDLVYSENLTCPDIGNRKKHSHSFHGCYYLIEEIRGLYGILNDKKSEYPSFAKKYDVLIEKLGQAPVYMENGDYVIKFADYLKESQKNENSSKMLSDSEKLSDAESILSNMEVLTSRIDKKAGKYYISHQLWESADSDKRYRLMESVADAHAVIEKKARKIQFIDDLTGKKIAEASPTWGIRLFN